MVKVCVCGGAGGIGQPMSMLMAMEPLVSELRIFDLDVAVVPAGGVAADLSHLERNCKVKGWVMEVGKEPIDYMKECLEGCQLVLIPAGLPRKPGMTRANLLNVNADIAKGLVEACANYCPNAVVALIVNPVNSIVPAMSALWEKAGLDIRKIVGVTTLDIVRANKFVAEKVGCDVKDVDIPVIGGHAGTTILPLFSQDAFGRKIPAADIADMDKQVQDAGTIVVEAKKGKGSATLSMAYAGARLGVAIVKGLCGANPVECAYVKSNVCPGLPFFASKVKFGPQGVQEILSMGAMSEHEAKRLNELTPTLKEEIDAGLKYAETTSFEIRTKNMSRL